MLWSLRKCVGAPDGPERPDGQDWLSSAEACRRLGITLPTLYRLIDEGRIAAYKFDAVIRLRWSDVEGFGCDGSG